MELDLDGNTQPKKIAWVKCPDCGRFTKNPWMLGPYWALDGVVVSWGGTCAEHGSVQYDS